MTYVGWLTPGYFHNPDINTPYIYIELGSIIPYNTTKNTRVSITAHFDLAKIPYSDIAWSCSMKRSASRLMGKAMLPQQPVDALLLGVRYPFFLAGIINSVGLAKLKIFHQPRFP